MLEEKVILVNNLDHEIGTMEKMEAHILGHLHRAFSVFVFDDHGKMMLQKRALSKYHSPGLWTNTCCSHPRKNENTEDAAHRRLQEEMGFDTPLIEAFSFIYKADVGQGLTEHEFDHVFIGKYNQPPFINPDEVDSWKFINMEELIHNININPDNYTVWFKIAFEKMQEMLKTNSISL